MSESQAGHPADSAAAGPTGVIDSSKHLPMRTRRPPPGTIQIPAFQAFRGYFYNLNDKVDRATVGDFQL